MQRVFQRSKKRADQSARHAWAALTEWRCAGDYRIRLRMIDSQGKQPEFVLSILPIKPSVVATADDAVAA